jgi:hypothetical protein
MSRMNRLTGVRPQENHAVWGSAKKWKKWTKVNFGCTISLSDHGHIPTNSYFTLICSTLQFSVVNFKEIDNYLAKDSNKV